MYWYTKKRSFINYDSCYRIKKKNSQKVVMFNLFHVQVYLGKKLCKYILVKVDKISVLFLRSGKGKVLGHLLQVCSSTSEKKNYGLQIQVFSVELDCNRCSGRISFKNFYSLTVWPIEPTYIMSIIADA